MKIIFGLSTFKNPIQNSQTILRRIYLIMEEIIMPSSGNALLKEEIEFSRSIFDADGKLTYEEGGARLASRAGYQGSTVGFAPKGGYRTPDPSAGRLPEIRHRASHTVKSSRVRAGFAKEDAVSGQ